MDKKVYNIAMSYRTLYHGSENVVEKPIYHYPLSGVANDYGLGFYCTGNLDMAKEWANRKTRSGYVSKYAFDERGLRILDLCDKSQYSVLNWIAILLHNRVLPETDRLEYGDCIAYLERFYVDVEAYDVVIGYRADDAYFAFPRMFLRNVLTYERLEEIYLLGNLGKQYVLISEKAFSRIKFLEGILSEPIFHDRYCRRKEAADNSYRELEREERTSKGWRLRDLMREEHD